MKKTKELSKWAQTKKAMGEERISLGPHYSYMFRKDPRRFLFGLSRYKFAAKLIGKNKSILDVGCSEGIGTWLLAEGAANVVAVDFDKEAIDEARKSFGSDRIEFKHADFLGARIGEFDAVVSLDVIEHIYENNEKVFLDSVCHNLKANGICFIGTPNKTAEQYSSQTSKTGHVNVYTWDRLKTLMDNYFSWVLLFSVNDEMVHTGYYPMAHYLIAVGIGKHTP